MKNRRLGLAAFVCAITSLGALVLASDRHLTRSQNPGALVVERPEAANPQAAPPSAEYLELQRRAIRQPSGQLTEDAIPQPPDVAMPQR